MVPAAMLQVGLTGNIASGKSAVARLWAEQGIPVLNADDVAREVVGPGSPGLRAVVDAFGSGVLGPDGALDRARMRTLVFADARARQTLESILHPRIRARRAEWLEEQRQRGAALVVAEIPLLFEVGLERDFDRIVVVDAPAPVRLARLVRERGVPEADARAMIAAQMDAGAKRARAHHVLDNGGTLDDLRRAALELLARLRAAAGSARG